MTYDVNGMPFPNLSAAVDWAKRIAQGLKEKGYEVSGATTTWDSPGATWKHETIWLLGSRRKGHRVSVLISGYEL